MKIKIQKWWILFKKIVMSRWFVPVVGIVIVISMATFIALKLFFPNSPQYEVSGHIVNKPFSIYFNSGVTSIDISQIAVSPKVSGHWSFHSGYLVGRDRLTFTPKTYFDVNTDYTVSLPHVKEIHFKTEPAPNLEATGFSLLKDGSVIASDYTFSAYLQGPNKGLRQLELRTDPAIDFKPFVSDDRKFSWKPTSLLPQGQKVNVEVYDTKNNVVLAYKTLQIAPQPTVQTPVKADHFGEHDVATIVFGQPMVTDNTSDMIFSIPGHGQWVDDTTYEFTPKSVSPDQAYVYTLKAGLRSKSGGMLTQDQSYSFATVGAVTATMSSPSGKNLKQASEQVSFTFDQPVDHSSAQQHFSITSGQTGAFTWTGNTMSTTVTNLGYQQTVTASVSAGVTNAGFGALSTQAFRTNFTTEIQIVRYNVPYFHQQYSGSCALASLRMILAYHGISSDDMTIVQRMGYNPTAEDKTIDPATWDDPWQMFVGSVDGKIKDGTGAGPDAPPVAKAAQSFGLQADYIMGTNVSWIAQQLYADHLVVFFGAYSNTDFTTWKTPSGRIEKMNLTSHAYAITGVQGNPANPIGFWVSDPINGQAYWSASELQAQMNKDAYQQAVVVY